MARLIERLDLGAYREARREENGTTDDQIDVPETSLPPITLFLQGIIVSGFPISVNTYLRRLRASAENSNKFTKSFFEAFYAEAESEPTDEELNEIKFSRIYIMDCYVINGGSRFEVSHMRVELEAVTAWTPGKLEAQ